MFRDLFDQFGRDCAQKIAIGHSLSEADAMAFSTLLAARERSGHRLLGSMAGPDPDTDTVTGRCGHYPARTYAATGSRPTA